MKQVGTTVTGPILVVEDDPAERELTVRAIARSQLPNPVTAVPDGESALRLLLDHDPAAAGTSADAAAPDAPGAAGAQASPTAGSTGRTDPALLAGHPGEPRLIVLDLRLPGISGIEVLRRLKADPRTHGIPVVVLTWVSDTPELRECYELGVNSYVLKSTDATVFGENLSRMLRYWAKLNEPVPVRSAVE